MTEVIGYSLTQERETRNSYTTRATNLVDRKWDPQREKIGLQTAPINIQVIKKPDQTTEYVATVSSHLSGDDFFDFLELVAPNKRPFDKRDVLADWDLPDRTDFLRDDNLVRRHKLLGENWEIFEQSRRIFMQSLTFNRGLLMRLAKDYWTRDMAKGRLRGFLIYPQRDKQLYSLFRRESYRRLLDPIQLPKMGRKKEKRDIKAKVAQYGTLKGKIRQEMVDNYLESLTEEERSEMRDAYVRADERFLLQEGVPLKNGPFEIKEVDGRVKIKSGDFTAFAVIDQQTTHGNGLLHIDEESIDYGCSITPVLHWTKDKDGHREYVFDFQADVDGTPIKTRNPLVGLLAIAYFCPDIADGWPENVGLPDEKEAQSKRNEAQIVATSSESPNDNLPKTEKRTQFMGPAQVPVLAIMHRESLLNSDFIQAVENFVQHNSN